MNKQTKITIAKANINKNDIKKKRASLKKGNKHQI